MAIPPGTDDKGHSVVLQARISPEMLIQIDTQVKRLGSEYLNRSEFIRESIHLNLTRVQNKDSKEKSSQAVLRVTEEVLYEEKTLRKQRDRIYRKLQKEVDAYLEKKAEMQACRVVLNTLAHLSGLPDGYWRDEFRRVIIERYAGLLSNAQGVELGDAGGGGNGNDGNDIEDNK